MTYLLFYEAKQLEGSYLTGFLFKPVSFITKTNVTSVAHLSPRLKIMNELLLNKKYASKVKEETFPFDTVFPALRLCINANSSD